MSSTGTSSTHTHAHARPPASPGLPGSPGPEGRTQHEVLQNFFQSLLSSRDRAGGGSTGTGTSTAASQPEGKQ